MGEWVAVLLYVTHLVPDTNLFFLVLWCGFYFFIRGTVVPQQVDLFV